MISNPSLFNRTKSSAIESPRTINPGHEDSSLSSVTQLIGSDHNNKNNSRQCTTNVEGSNGSVTTTTVITKTTRNLSKDADAPFASHGLISMQDEYHPARNKSISTLSIGRNADHQFMTVKVRKERRGVAASESFRTPGILETVSYLFILTLTLCSFCTASLCDTKSWWNAALHRCTPCTVCEGEMIPLRPCQVHQDTVCGSIYDLKIDWVVLARTEPNWKDRRKFDYGQDYELDHQQLTAEQLQQLEEEVLPLNWQTAALFLAVFACLLFFIVAACILVHHTRQWRRMERRLDQDVEELSTKLMAKLAEVQSLESGTFFIGNAEAWGIPTVAAATNATSLQQAQQHHHHLQHHSQHQMPMAEKSLAGHQGSKTAITNTTNTTRHIGGGAPKSGNVYIEENGGSK